MHQSPAQITTSVAGGRPGESAHAQARQTGADVAVYARKLELPVFAVVFWLAASACGDRVLTVIDTSPSSAPLGPAAMLGPFGSPSSIGPISSPMSDDLDPTLPADELELYFASTRMTMGMGSFDIWVARRATKTDPWGAPTRVDELSTTAYTDRTPAISWDGLTIWFTSTRPPGLANFAIWVSTRATRSDPWSAPAPVAELSTVGNNFAPAVDASELTMYFTSDRGGGGPGNGDVYVSTRPTTTSLWGAAQPVTALNSGDGDWDPFISSDGRTFFWAPLGATNPVWYIDWVTAAGPTGPFSTPTALKELGPGSSGPWLSVDLRHIVFVSNRTGNSAIYEAFR